MLTNEGDCRVVVVGAGAGGTLVATHLVTALSSRFRVELVDPAPTTGAGRPTPRPTTATSSTCRRRA